MWLAFISMVFGITLLFMTLSARFERRVKKKFKPLRHFPLVSIIIPAYKSAHSIGETLKSVKNSNYPNKEVIVVNDSADDTPKIARLYRCRVIQNNTRRGKWHAINIGAEKAKGNPIMILDSDTTLHRNTIRNLVSSFTEYKDNGENVGMVSPRYTARNKKNILAKLCNIEQSFHQSLLKAQMNFKSVLSSRGCCLLIAKDVFKKVGGFSPSILEDGDFSAKVIEAGCLIKYEPRALVHTKEPETFSQLLRAKRRYGKGTFYCLLNHRKTFGMTKQSFICFYPNFLLAVAFLGFLIFQNPFTTIPYLILLIGFSFSAISINTLIILLTLISTLGIALGTATNAIQLSTLKASLSPAILFILIFTPIVTYAYFRGFLSGVNDKIHDMPEFNLKDW